jgi:hypothetical protein
LRAFKALVAINTAHYLTLKASSGPLFAPLLLDIPSTRTAETPASCILYQRTIGMSVIDIKMDGLSYAMRQLGSFAFFGISRPLSLARHTDPTELIDGYKQPSGSADVASYENNEKSTFVLVWRQDARPA